MNSKKLLKPIMRKQETEPVTRKRQYHAIDSLETDDFNIKSEIYENETSDEYTGENFENEEYLEEDSGDPVTATEGSNLGESLGNWARKNRMSHESFSDLTKVLKRAGLKVPDSYSSSNKKINLQNINSLMMSIHNQMIELRQQNTGILNKMKILETQVYKCNSTLDNILQTKVQMQPIESDQSINQISFTLPINDFDVLESLEESLADETIFKEFVKTVKATCANNLESSRYLLTLVFGENIILNYNWDGSQSKKPLRNLKNLNRALFDAWKGDDITNQEEYVIFLRMKFYQAKKKIHQTNHRLKKKSQ